MSLFVDLIAAGEARTNQALEVLCKAHGDDDSSVWDPHWSPLVRQIIELFTERGLMRLDGVRKELLAWMDGSRHQPGALLPRPDGTMGRWTANEMRLVQLYLASLPEESWSLDDHMLMVDLVCQRHLPADDMRTEAEWLAQRAVLMGKVQKELGELTLAQADKVLQAPPPGGLGQLQRRVLEFAQNRAAEHVTSLADQARHQLRGIVARHVEARQLGQERGHSLETELLDTFGMLNRDWRRIAVTEAVEAQNQGYVAAQPPGTKLKRFEHYKSACSWCKKIDGMVVEVVSPDAPDKDGERQVWVGKTNVGRSAAARKRQGDMLVERDPSERYWIAAGAQHPHCRGAWLPVVQDEPGDDLEFNDWMRGVLEGKE